MTTRRADYEAIASHYDEDRAHWRIASDDVIASFIESGVDSLEVLDVGCGTGNYLTAQAGNFAAASIRWTGVDQSRAMLAVARGKIVGSVMQASAEALPFSSAVFDYVYSSFAFHHFDDKASALDECTRVLGNRGCIRIRNMDPWSMERSWGYVFFPEVREFDERRFWPGWRLEAEIKARGFAVQVAREVTHERHRVDELLVRAERRAISQLAILEDDPFNAGIERLRAVIHEDSDATIESETARLVVTAARM